MQLYGCFIYGHKFPPIRAGGNLFQPPQKNDKNYEKKIEKNIFQPTYENTRKNKAKKKKKNQIYNGF
jgi:hypothetical protein